METGGIDSLDQGVILSEVQVTDRAPPHVSDYLALYALRKKKSIVIIFYTYWWVKAFEFGLDLYWWAFAVYTIGWLKRSECFLT
jgi:hypothetical protein